MTNRRRKLKSLAYQRMRARHRQRYERLALQRKLDALVGYDLIHIQSHRMTVGEKYNFARVDECMLTLSGSRAIIVPLDRFGKMVHELPLVRLHPGILFKRFSSLAERWTRERKPVRHPEWIPGKGRRTK